MKLLDKLALCVSDKPTDRDRNIAKAVALELIADQRAWAEAKDKAQPYSHEPIVFLDVLEEHEKERLG